MPREKPGYRLIMEQLTAVFPERGAITVSEAARFYGVSERTLKRDKTFPIGPHGKVTLAAFARWMTV